MCPGLEAGVVNKVTRRQQLGAPAVRDPVGLADRAVLEDPEDLVAEEEAVSKPTPIRKWTIRLIILTTIFMGATLLRVAFFLRLIPDYGPHSISWLLNPFRHSVEIVDGQHRTEIGCYGVDGYFRWKPVNAEMITVFDGSHHFKVLQYALWTGSASHSSFKRRNQSIREFFCKPSVVSHFASCAQPASIIGLRNRSLSGVVIRNEAHDCL